jgi:hypothetical protein
MAEVSEEHLEACTAVLMTVPLPIARRLETFLVANEIACKIRRNETLTPEQLAEEAVRSATPQAAKMLDSPLVGRLLRTRIKRGATIEVASAGTAPAYDVLVRPETLPAAWSTVEETPSPSPGPAEQPADPWARPGQAPPTTAPASSPGMTAITALPWDAAWALAGRLQAADIPATVLPAADAGGGSIGEAMFQVVVQAGDADRATELASGAPASGPPPEQ